MKRGQTEMIGLVFIVIVLVIGIVLYLRFSIPDSPLVSQKEIQGVTSFLIALKETTVPSCGTSFERVAAACLEKTVLCTSRDPCGEAQETMELLATTMLLRQGYKYNLSIADSSMTAIDGCESANPRVELIAAPRVPIIYAGSAQQQMILAICR